MTEKEKLKKIKSHCPNCGGDINSDIVANYEHRVNHDDEYGCIWTHESHNILKCCGCDTIYFQTTSAFSEDYDMSAHPITGDPVTNYHEKISYWPSPSQRDRPFWLHKIQVSNEPLYEILQEIYVAFDNDLKVLAATGIRTGFDASTEALGIDPAKTFREKLDDLQVMGKIGEEERKVLGVLTDAGGAAAHRGWAPTRPQLHTMMSIVEQFIYRNLILTDRTNALKKKVPPKPKRKTNKDSNKK